MDYFRKAGDYVSSMGTCPRTTIALAGASMLAPLTVRYYLSSVACLRPNMLDDKVQLLGIELVLKCQQLAWTTPITLKLMGLAALGVGCIALPLYRCCRRQPRVPVPIPILNFNDPTRKILPSDLERAVIPWRPLSDIFTAHANGQIPPTSQPERVPEPAPVPERTVREEEGSRRHEPSAQPGYRAKPAKNAKAVSRHRHRDSSKPIVDSNLD